VIAVKDGDTIHVLVNRSTYKIRLDGIDCPEKDQAFGAKARQFTSAMVFGKTVRVALIGKDQYQRWLGKVYTLGGTSLNEALLSNGLAWHYKHYNSEKRLAKLESNARSKRIGIWSQKNPIPPWDFRKAKRK
ncbi:MAG TPA: thermonuclease family protein, partial [Candidatus Cloacimonadota bacterium]|nr:thermonuclease family protein [Candidatus Cloacimonadota bacterium]